MTERYRCRHYRAPQLVSGGGGSTTCERGIAYADLLPTQEARGSGWVRRLPCADFGSLPRLPGGLPCPHYLEETLAEDFAKFEPVRRIAIALEHVSREDRVAIITDREKNAAFVAAHSKPLAGVTTLERTDEHVKLLCSCGGGGEHKHTAIARKAPIECFWCGRVYEVQRVRGDLTLVQIAP